jgi:hypothetical protein
MPICWYDSLIPPNLHLFPSPFPRRGIPSSTGATPTSGRSSNQNHEERERKKKTRKKTDNPRRLRPPLGPMSLSARERQNPPPRRKSCSACIKAKRRCDTALPSCLRCSQRRITCVYPARTGAPQLEQFLLDQDMLSSLDSMDTTALPAVAEKSTAPRLLSFEDAPRPDDSLTVLLADADPPFIDVVPFLELDASTPMELIHETSWLDRRDETRTGIVADIIAKRLRYAMDQMRNAPHMFVSENRTPWCHSQLYADEMPRCIRGRYISRVSRPRSIG